MVFQAELTLSARLSASILTPTPGRMQSGWERSTGRWRFGDGDQAAEEIFIATPVGQIPGFCRLWPPILPRGFSDRCGQQQRLSVPCCEGGLPSGGMSSLAAIPWPVRSGGASPPIRTFFENALAVLTPTPEQKDHYLTGKAAGAGPSHRSEAHFHGPLGT